MELWKGEKVSALGWGPNEFRVLNYTSQISAHLIWAEIYIWQTVGKPTQICIYNVMYMANIERQVDINIKFVMPVFKNCFSLVQFDIILLNSYLNVQLIRGCFL